MVKDISPDDSLGGMTVLSNMLTGAGPVDFDDPIQDPPITDTDVDDDDDDVAGVVDFDDDDAPVDDPIQDPDASDDDPIIEPSKKDDKPKLDDSSSADDTYDLSEYQEDISSYLKDELETSLGWNIPDDYEIKSVEDIVGFMKELVTEASKPDYANEEVSKFDEFVKNGGNLREFYSSTAEGRINTDEVDIENEFNQKLVLQEHLKNQGYSETQIERRLNRYDEAGVLGDEANDALEMLKEYNTKQEEKLLAHQQNEAERIQNEQQMFVGNVEESVKGLETVRGIKISDKDKNELLDYILKTDNSGMTQYQLDYMSSINNLVESAYFTKNGQALVDKSKKQGKTEAYRSLHQKLKTNKGNKGKTNEGRDYSDSASSGLSLIGKQLLG